MEAPLWGLHSFMKVNFLTTTNTSNGYGMTREYFLKYLPKFGVQLEDHKAENPITLILHIPPAIQHVKKGIKVLYTMIEGDEVPESWKRYLAMADHILVPTDFVKKTFEKAGFEAHTIPLGYDPDLFTNAGVRENEVFTFFHYEAFQDRKGWQDLLEAWYLSGLAEEELNCKLILKTVKTYRDIYEKLHDESFDTFLPYNAKIVCGELPHHCMFDMLSEADCFVFPSRGEGFSLPPIEAMATGLPTIITKGHSHMDYYNEDYMYGVDCNIKIPAVYHSWEDQGNFVRCNPLDLANVLKHVYENRTEAVIKGQASVEYVKKYVYSETARKMFEFLCRL